MQSNVASTVVIGIAVAFKTIVPGQNLRVFMKKNNGNQFQCFECVCIRNKCSPEARTSRSCFRVESRIPEMIACDEFKRLNGKNAIQLSAEKNANREWRNRAIDQCMIQQRLRGFDEGQ